MAPLAFLDVAYGAGASGVAAVLSDAWTADSPLATLARRIARVPEPYEPGQF